MHACCSWSQLVATTSNEQQAFKCQKVVKKLHRMWNWDDIKKRLASGRVETTREQHRFKLNRCECCFTDLKKLREFNIGLSNLVDPESSDTLQNSTKQFLKLIAFCACKSGNHAAFDFTFLKPWRILQNGIILFLHSHMQCNLHGMIKLALHDKKLWSKPRYPSVLFWGKGIEGWRDPMQKRGT